MPAPKQPQWWEIRRAQNRKPATYRCPLCGELLPALSEHMLMFPEGDHSHRRHAHARCVLDARKRGKLLTRDEWTARQPAESSPKARWREQFSWLDQLTRRGRGRP